MPLSHPIRIAREQLKPPKIALFVAIFAFGSQGAVWRIQNMVRMSPSCFAF